MTAAPLPHDAAAHLAALVESSEDAIVSKTLDGIVLTWNQAARRIFGYDAEEMIGQSIRKLIPDDRQSEEDHILSRVLAGDRVSSFLTQRLRKDGSIVRVSITVSPILDAAGAIVGASKIARDAGPYLDEQAAKIEAQQRFLVLADNMHQFAWIADSKGWIYWYNKRWYDYTGTTLEEMQGWGWQAVHHPDHVDRVTKRIQRSWDTGEPWEDTFPLRGTDGEYRWFLSRALPIRDESGAIRSWFGTNTDVTDLLQKEEQIRLLMMEVNHRSKNLLAVVQSLLRRSVDGEQAFVRRFEDRLASLAANQDLLTKRGWTAISVRELVEAQLAFLTREALAHITIEGPAFLIGPRAAETIGMALHELTTNALKYGGLSCAEGRVAIRWDITGNRFTLEWAESGAPPIAAPPQRTGFGTTLIRDVPARSLQADVDLEYAAPGLRWRIACDKATVASTDPLA